MDFFDPSRPRISGLPAFAPGQGVGLSVIPALYFAPRSGGDTIEISGFFSVGANRSSRFVTEIPVGDFPEFWQHWLSDPEDCARKAFQWKPADTPMQSAPVCTLAPPPTPLSPFDFDELLEGLE